MQWKGGLVSTGSGDEERAWAADKRDFVADQRDKVADERDRVADTRDRTADDREAGSTSGNGGWTPAPRTWRSCRGVWTACTAGRGPCRTVSGPTTETRRGQNGQEQLPIGMNRQRRRRRSTTRLAMVFADIAEQLYDADSVDDVLSRIADAAVSTIAGCPDGKRHPP